MRKNWGEIDIDLLFDFLVEQKGFSEEIALGQCSDVIQFAKYMRDSTNLCNSDEGRAIVNMYQMRHYLAHLHELELDRITINNRMLAVKEFFEYLIKQDKSTYNFVGRGYFEDTLLLLNAPDLTKPQGLRDKAVIELLYGSGLNLSQLVRLNISDCDVQLGLFTVSKADGDSKYAPIGQWAQIALEEYFDRGRPYLDKGRTKDALFIDKKGQRITERWVRFLISKYIKKVSLETNICSQALRDSFATHLVEGGTDASVVEDLLGYINTPTTQEIRFKL
ncbi:integrase/recombinase XerC [Desulfitispora alkaliphila]|uniref:tyrosine-type recombinase/integrase n=1 Tax=Desulfitispora alkaliphila TaxID=622674 RepID=UPI003D2611EB